MLTITHSHETGTLIEGTAKGDGTAPILKQNGWTYRPVPGWFIRGSRDHDARRHTIARTRDALQEAGYVVELAIDNTARPTAEVEADKIARQADRVDRLTERADRKATAEDTAWARERAAISRLPEGGEPIKVGHHSERRHRAALSKADTATRRAIDATADAAHAATRAETAARTTDLRYSPQQVASRITRIQTQIRATERGLNGSSHNFGGGLIETHEPATGTYRERLVDRLATEQDQLAYWQGIRAEQIEAGTATDYSRDTIRPGDRVQVGRGAAASWDLVVRANPKTVTVQPDVVPFTLKYDYARITGHRPATT